MKTTLRLITCGSVDDGKSTLIGRLLQDANLAKEDQVADAKKVSEALGGNNPMAYMCDGLQEEREKGITIDVANRYFETERHKYIIRDCPGHAEFQHNMATGCSQADVAVIMIDSSRGVEGCITEQTRAHFFTVGMFNLPIVFVCINKLDMEKDPAKRLALYDGIVQKVNILAWKYMSDMEVKCIPVSALTGANVVHEDPEMFPWYVGDTLFNSLENIDEIETHLHNLNAAFQVTSVVRHGGECYIQGKMLTGWFEQNSELGFDGNPCLLKLTSIQIGKRDTFLMTQAGLSYTLTVEGNVDDIKPGSILHKEDYVLHGNDSSSDLSGIQYMWWGNTKTGKDDIGVLLHGKLVRMKLISSAASLYKGDYGVMEVWRDGWNCFSWYGHQRNPLGALVLVDLDTNETAGVATILT